MSLLISHLFLDYQFLSLSLPIISLFSLDHPSISLVYPSVCLIYPFGSLSLSPCPSPWLFSPSSTPLLTHGRHSPRPSHISSTCAVRTPVARPSPSMSTRSLQHTRTVLVHPDRVSPTPCLACVFVGPSRPHHLCHAMPHLCLSSWLHLVLHHVSSRASCTVRVCPVRSHIYACRPCVSPASSIHDSPVHPRTASCRSMPTAAPRISASHL